MTMHPSPRPQLAYYTPETNDPWTETIEVDICIYGATSAGVIAAVQAAQGGRRVCLLANGTHIGGLTSSGLGNTDIGNSLVIGGLARDFYRRIGAHYGKEEQWRFEPHVAAAVFRELLHAAGVVPVCGQFVKAVVKEEGRITEILCVGGLKVRAGCYIDASYEGDLLAAARVPFTVGREGNELYGELLNGVQIRETHQFEFRVSPWRREGDPSSGLLPGVAAGPPGLPGSGDQLVQAYNFRMCLTRGPERVSFPRPADYRPDHYELLARYLRGGWRQLFRKFDAIPGDKTDTNNHGAVSTDFIGANHTYPNATYQERERIYQEHVNYQQGLMWFLCHDERCPADVRKAMGAWGLAGDEFENTAHWPPQLYIREARRMVGDYVITEHDCRGYRRAEDSVGCGAYAMDSHNCQRVLAGDRVLNEGDVQTGGFAPYPISYRAIIPPRGSIENLLVPVCVSTSHIAFGSVRMEPVFMVLGQSAAIAAGQALDFKCSVQGLDFTRLRKSLEAEGQVLGVTATDDCERQKWEVGVV